MVDILIVGGGVTGLSAGIHLLLNGGADHHVTICEKHTVPGGNLTGWKRAGCYIDNCIHWLNGTNPDTDLYKEWLRLGALDGVRLHRRESLYTCRLGEDELSLWRDAERTERAMLWYSPDDEREIRRLFRAVRTLQRLSGLERGADLSARRTVSGLGDLMRYARLTTGELAARFRHPLLRQFLISVGDRSFSALAQLEVMAHFCGGNADLPFGGSRAMAERMAERFRSLGGVLRLGATVESVAYASQEHPRHAVGVRIRQGKQQLYLPADYVIVTADPASICETMLDVQLPPRLARLYATQPPLRFSAVQAAFRVPVERVNFSGELILPFPRQERACPHESSVLLREFSHEPDFAPPGYTVVQAMAFCSEPEARRILSLSHADYASFKQDVGNCFARILNHVCPPVAGQDDTHLLDVWTPVTYRRFVGTEIGSFMSYIMTPSAVLRAGIEEAGKSLHIGKQIGTIPGVENILLAGQWLRAPGGLPIAAGEGRRVAGTVLRRLRVQEPGRIHVRLSGTVHS